VEEREETKTGQLCLYKDIFFSDAAGAAPLVTCEVVSATIAGIKVHNAPIQSSASEQIAGTYVTGSWNCENKGIYTVVLLLRIYDRQSQAVTSFNWISSAQSA
jgi:hypothetical protein